MSSSAESVRNVGISDQSTGDDYLGFEPYVTAIAEFLLNEETKPPLTLSIEGEWGSGKSSFMKQLDKYLRKKGQRTVWFNAWRHDKAEAVWAAFALSFIKQISTPQTFTWKEYKKKNEKENKKASLQTYLVDILRANYHVFRGHVRLARSRFDLKKGWLELLQIGFIAIFVICAALSIPFILAIYGMEGIRLFLQAFQHPDQLLQAFLYLLGIAGGGSLSLAGLANLLKKFPSIIGGPKFNLIKYLKSPDYAKQSAFIEEFHEDFAKIVKAYIGDGRVFVFIDDLDRCEHPKSADLMQAINLMIADDPSVVFILGMDREKVAASLAVKYETILAYLPSENPEIDPDILARRSANKGLAYGYTFIEKFVQLPFQVPQPSKADCERFVDKLGTSSSSNSSVSTSLPPSPKRHFFWRSFPWLKDSTKTSSNITIENQEETPISKNLEAMVQTEITEEKQPEKPKNELSERIKLTFERDSPTVKHIAMMVAPALDYNPRRIKQFINVFRLKAYIAYETGLFYEEKNNEQEIINNHLTLQQLGKFTAISLRWPLLLLDLETDGQLLHKLEDSALSPHFIVPNKIGSGFRERANELDRDKNVRYWDSHRKLKELMAYGCLEKSEDDQTPQINPIFSLAEMKVERLLQVSPLIVRPTLENESKKEVIYEYDTAIYIPVNMSEHDQFKRNPYTGAILLPGGIELEMMDIPAGEFMMGSDENTREKPIHKVLVNAFEIGKYPITQEQYESVMKSNPSSFKGNPKNPVENVNWNDAQLFCQKLTQLSGQIYRLPTEAEWEYACRAGTQTRYYFGDDETQLENYAWYKNNAKGITHLVGQKNPNNWGIYDMSGNVWEWCADKWKNNYAKENNKDYSSNLEFNDDNFVVVRGGSWEYNSERCRSAYRAGEKAGIRFSGIGFRVVSSQNI